MKKTDEPGSRNDLDPPAETPPGGHAARRRNELLKARFPGGCIPPDLEQPAEEPPPESTDDLHDL
jgi:hypothetical protein